MIFVMVIGMLWVLRVLVRFRFYGLVLMIRRCFGLFCDRLRILVSGVIVNLYLNMLIKIVMKISGVRMVVFIWFMVVREVVRCLVVAVVIILCGLIMLMNVVFLRLSLDLKVVRVIESGCIISMKMVMKVKCWGFSVVRLFGLRLVVRMINMLVIRMVVMFFLKCCIFLIEVRCELVMISLKMVMVISLVFEVSCFVVVK